MSPTLNPLEKVSSFNPKPKSAHERSMTRLLSNTFRAVKPHRIDIQNKSSPSKQSSSSWSVYLIISTNKPIKTYVGVTTDFSRRLKQHNGDLKGGAKASRAGRPWICACIIQGFKDHSEACELEAKWKNSSRKLSRKRRTDDMNEAENEGSLVLLQHRQAALDKIRGSFDFSHLDIDWKLNPS
ncbi:hypothetical protein AQUCO_01400753v1 [Aquilegia coerulea]|uniref:GIY-YIG domain-containing protein n=1 Tax=Aquilegia coerulea TaxID=218851 RepID=A0A2G5DXU9_AQUCA|nr:hypothetical protein AQUCO_01400753v1 [Aquilegia coerulea]